MANADIVNGAVPKGPVLRMQEYKAGAICYPGDLLKFKSDGTVEPVSAATDACMGVCMVYAASAAQVLVADDPNQMFIMQADDATIDAQTDIGLNYEIAIGSPDTTYRRSGMEIDASTQATTAALPLKVLRIVDSHDNALGANVKCVVKINNHQLGSHTGTAGV
jgi:hypothetical protein